jgi:hypothetical protein
MREKAARLERSAAAWEAGAAGERATGAVLAGLDPSLWSVLHDVRWPGRSRANIDHIAIGPGGVFVIDSKHWSGTVAVKDGVLRQNGYSREKEVVGAAEAAIAVLEHKPDVPVQPVICLVRDEPFSGWVRDVMLCSTANLTTMLTTRPPALSPDDVRRVSDQLRKVLQTVGAPSGPSSRSTTARPSRRSRSRSGKGGRRFAGVLAVVALTFGGLQLGLLDKAAGVVQDFVGSTVEDKPTKQPAKKPAHKQRRDNRS